MKFLIIRKCPNGCKSLAPEFGRFMTDNEGFIPPLKVATTNFPGC